MPDASPLSLDPALQGWIGRSETVFDTVTPQLAQRLAATLESPRAGRAGRGDELPQLWHSVLFPRVAPRSQLGRDGHPALGDFLPPVPLPRRMFAGKRTTFVAPILIGDELERVSTIASIAPKQGRSGPLIFVTVRHDVRRGGDVLVSEEHDVVYRSESPAASAGAGQAEAAAPAPFGATRASDETAFDPVTIFRYSALSFNGHRIHYDRKYATEVEGYPSLLVNGQLGVLYGVEHVLQAWGGRLSTLATRNVGPLFEGERFRAESKAGAKDGEVDFRVVTTAGKTVVAGTAQLEGAPR
ncbi:MaoC family dehydratase N-terminal domain-containing protein [Pigmentiphaga soli]|uniref:MaoC family dehydratase N-terminal domain-containing protein n=1 Tax=Pigmentiphaga soli TaxID=1007095 RepID=A0ABP8HJ97_9BURK